jgi:hypothetical protein
MEEEILVIWDKIEEMDTSDQKKKKKKKLHLKDSWHKTSMKPGALWKDQI